VSHTEQVTDLIIELLPFAAGVFASPLPVIIGIVLLFTPRPRPTSVTYVVTWIAGLTFATVVLSLLAGSIEGLDGQGPWGARLKVALGLILIYFAVRMWLGRADKSTPAWLSALMDASPREAVRYGVLMSAANPKELLMAAAAGLAVGASDVGTAEAASAIAIFVAIGAASVAAPLVVFLVGGQSTLRTLTTWREWLQRNSVVVAAVVLAAIGAMLLVSGLAKL